MKAKKRGISEKLIELIYSLYIVKSIFLSKPNNILGLLCVTFVSEYHEQSLLKNWHKTSVLLATNTAGF